jgi:hypothetical protein
MALTVLNKGSTTDTNTNCPTNPRIKTNTSASASAKHFTIVQTDDSSNLTFDEISSGAGLLTEYTNLATTQGHIIKNFNAFSQDGVSLTINETHYWFVLLHSDDANKHHFARITETLTDDADGDSFEFTPKLGNEVPKGTKFMLFKGPLLTSNAIAFSAGIDDSLRNDLVCSRPLFYIEETKVNKKGELDHNTKYFVQSNSATSGASITVNSIKSAFLVEQDYSNAVVDYSPFSLKVSLTDVLRNKDVAGTPVPQESSYSLPTEDFTDYEDVFYNARRQADNDISGTINLTGPTRYLHYDFSPEYCNVAVGVIESEVTDSIGSRAGFAEVKIIDNNRIYPKKVTEEDALRARHVVHNGNFTDFFELKAELDTHTGSRAYTVISDYADLSTMINVTDEIKIGNRIVIVSAVTTNTITFEEFSRLETEGELTNSTNLESLSGTLSRRAYNSTDNTLLTDFNIIEGRDANMFIRFQRKNFKFLYASVSASDKNKQTLTLSFLGDGYDSNPLKYCLGKYQLFIQRFDGAVESIETTKEFGQTFVKLEGRSNIRKLLSPIINSNKLFSRDMIYSSRSFYNTLSDISRTVVTTGNYLKGSAKTFDLNSSTSDISAGDEIYARFSNGVLAYVGRAASDVSSATVTLEEHARVASYGNSNVSIYVSQNKFYVFNKALAANRSETRTVTALEGSANKGVLFDSGTQLDSSGNDGNTLVGTSSDDNANALGYPIHHPTNMKNDRFFQSRLRNTDDTPSREQTFDVVNTLIDFSVLDISTSDTETKIELAPYVPLTLARVDINHGHTLETTFEDVGTVTSSPSGNRHIVAATLTTYYSIGDPVYIDGVFAGICIQITTTGAGVIKIYLDRPCEVDDTGKLQRVAINDSGTYSETQNYNHSLSILNGAHLHGGKVIAMLHPDALHGNSNYLPAVFDTPYGITSQTFDSYSQRYGSPYFRIFNLEFGNIQHFDPVKTSFAEDFSMQYYDEPSEIKYYADAYRFGPGYFQSSDFDHITGVGRTGSGLENQPLIETAGFQPVTGSRFFDVKHIEKNGTAPFVFKPEDATGSSDSPFIAKDILEQPDSKVARMFLFVTSDITPYSSRRKDSLMNSTVTRDLTNYSIMLKKEESTVNTVTTKSFSSAQTKPQTNIDSDYEFYNISSSDAVSGLKRFGLMRLTECVYDWHFNQIDPENLPNKESVLPKFTYKISDPSHTNVTVTSTSGAVLTVTNSPITAGFLANDYVLDNQGRFIGTVSSMTSSSITLSSDANKTNDGNYYTGTVTKVRPSNIKDATISGRGTADTFDHLDDIHMLKGAVFDKDLYNSTKKTNWFVSDYGAMQGLQDGSYPSSIVLPPNLGDKLRNHTTHDSHASEVIKLYQQADDTSHASSDFMKDEALPVFLDRFGIEDGTNNVTKGTVAPRFTKISPIYKASNFYQIGLFNDARFYRYGDLKGDIEVKQQADGVYLGMKFRLHLDETSLSTVSVSTLSDEVGGANLKKYVIETSDESEHYWLNFVGNLSGCYLVSEAGRYIQDVENNGVTTNVLSADQDQQESINGLSPSGIMYIMSHEIDVEDTTRKHILITNQDVVSSGGDYFRIMQPNHICTHEFTPKTIVPKVLSSEYTKVNGEANVYKTISSYSYKDLKQGPTGSYPSKNQGGQEAALSMYVMVDLDKQQTSQSPLIVMTNASQKTVLPHGSYNMCVSDGDTTYKTEVTSSEINNDQTAINLTFAEMKKTVGVVSVSETFTLTVPNQVNGEFKRANIGVGVTIGHEVDNVLNDLLESNDIAFDQNKQTYPKFISPNFQGVDLLSAVNYAAKKKELTLIEDEGIFKVVEKKNNSNYTDVLLSDFGDYQIFNYKNESTIFDKFNEIVVFGRSHKTVRKNLRDIKKFGKKTLEVFERELASQEDVDARATELFLLHNRANKKLVLEVGHKGISQLRPGDIINVEIRRENIPRNQYFVLEVKHLLTGNMILELGLFSKKLEDRFAELLIQGRKTNTAIREQAFNEDTSSFDVLETLKVKPLRLLVRKRSSAGATLGFGITLGFGSTFTGLGTITETDLVDVEF